MPAKVTQVPSQNFSLGTTITLAAGHLLNDFYYNFLPILLPIIMPKLGLSLTMSGLLIMVYAITSNLLQPFFGFLFDRWNLGKFLLLPVIPFGAVCMTMIHWVDSQAMLFLIIALVGLSVSSYHPLGSSIVAHTTPGEKLGSVMSYYIAGGNAGYALAPFVVVLFLAVYPTTMLPWLTIPAFLFALLCAKKKLHRIPTQVLTQRAARIDEILKNKNAVVLTLSMAFRCIPHVSTTTFLPLLLVTAGYSSIMSGTMLTLFLVGCTVGGLIGGYLGDRFSHKAVVVSSLFLGIFPTAYFFFHAGTEPLSCIALFLAGAFILAPQPSSLVWAQKAMPGAEAVASGLMMGFSFGLASLGAAAIAALGDHIGLGPALLISVISLPIGGIAALVTPYPKK